MDLLGAFFPQQNPRWHDLIRPLGLTTALTVAFLVAIVVTGAPWNGYLAVFAVVVGGFTLLFGVAAAGIYVLDEL